MFGWTCGDCRLLFFCRRAMGCGQRPAFPAPSDCEGDRFAKLGRGWRREAADVYPSACVGDTSGIYSGVVASEAKQSRIARAALDGSAPRCLAMTELLAGHVLHYSCRRPPRIAPSARPKTSSGGRCSTSGRRYEPRSRGVLDPPPARSMTMCWMCNLAPHGCRKARIGAACSLTPSARHPPPSRCRRRR
jgi:hypothetical protein